MRSPIDQKSRPNKSVDRVPHNAPDRMRSPLVAASVALDVGHAEMKARCTAFSLLCATAVDRE
jgi:hypothetical protein